MNAAAHNINPPTDEFSGWERLRQAVSRLRIVSQLENVSGSTKTLRTEQVGVMEDFRRFMAGIIEASESDETIDPTRVAFGRIILPPRTGKTVIAGQIIAATGLAAVFIASSRALASQIIRDLREQLPDIPVGTFTGESKELVDVGVNVTTYNMLWQAFKRDEVPPQIRRAGIVFADEGHRSMTARRMKMLLGTFEQMVPRVALTATPDYHQEERQLVRYYPTLIHEITAPEAIELGLLAPTRVWVVEVDDDASKVELLAGDFNPVTVGRLMSHGPYFEAVRHFRYLQERGDDDTVNDNRSLSALICCVNRQQAYDLHKFLRERRPAGTPEPGLILGETTMEQRESLLARYDRGQIDTLITVNVLREGWNAPRCKLLITLAPTLSPVRAMQTYFRPMTKWGGSEAHIYVLVPKNLPYPPILPMDFFSADAEDYECGTLIGFAEQAGKKRYPPSRVHRLRRVPIERVELKSRILLAGLLVPPKLQRDDWDGVRQVLTSALNLQHPPPNYLVFRRMFFQHRLFTGRGEQLLRYLKVPSSQLGYLGFLTKVMPEMVGALYLNKRDEQFANEAWCGVEAGFRFTSHGLTRWEPEGVAESLAQEEWGMLTGTAITEQPNEYEACALSERDANLARMLKKLKPSYRTTVVNWYLDDLPDSALAGIESVTSSTVGARRNKALRELRYPSYTKLVDPGQVPSPLVKRLRARVSSAVSKRGMRLPEIYSRLPAYEIFAPSRYESYSNVTIQPVVSGLKNLDGILFFTGADGRIALPRSGQIPYCFLDVDTAALYKRYEIRLGDGRRLGRFKSVKGCVLDDEDRVAFAYSHRNRWWVWHANTIAGPFWDLIGPVIVGGQVVYWSQVAAHEWRIYCGGRQWIIGPADEIRALQMTEDGPVVQYILGECAAARALDQPWIAPEITTGGEVYSQAPLMSCFSGDHLHGLPVTSLPDKETCAWFKETGIGADQLLASTAENGGACLTLKDGALKYYKFQKR